tara:strand:+ start:10 stop:252 length:243 start_codon:yes stop_codon:yes gene_type:complete
MKFIIALIILFEGSIKPDTYMFAFDSFLTLESCNAVLEKEEKYFKSSVQDQFGRLNIKEYLYTCMTLKEYNELTKQELGA